jgi:hypothetical protein
MKREATPSELLDAIIDLKVLTVAGCGKSDARFDQHDRRFDMLDRRLGRIETRIEDIEQKLPAQPRA